LFHGHELAELPELLQVAAYLDSNVVVDAAHPERGKSAGGDERLDDPAGFREIGRVEQRLAFR